MYKLYVCPGMSWLLGLLDLPLSWIERKLDSVPTRFLKKWCGLPATTNPSILYLSEESFGLSLPKLSTTFQSITSCNLRYLLQSKDPMVQQLAEAEVHHQQQLCNRKFLPATLASSSLSCKDIRKVTKSALSCHRKILEERVVQGALMRSGVAGNPSRQEICPGRDGFPRKLASELGNPSRPACSRKSVSGGTDFLGNRSRS